MPCKTGEPVKFLSQYEHVGCNAFLLMYGNCRDYAGTYTENYLDVATFKSTGCAKTFVLLTNLSLGSRSVITIIAYVYF